MVHTLGPLLVMLVFGKKKQNISEEASLEETITNTNKAKTLNTILNRSRVENGVCGQGLSYNYMEVGNDVITYAKYRYLKMDTIPDSYHQIIGELFNDDFSFTAKGNDKMVICFSLLPYLLIDSMDDPKVWSIVNFFILLSCIFNHDGPYRTVCVYQLLIRIVLYNLEMHTSPTVSSLYSHYSFHLDKAFVDSGPLKGTDTMHSESQYKGLSSQTTGGPKPVITMFRREANRRSACLIMYGIQKEGSNGVAWNGCKISTSYDAMRISQSDYFIKRSIINMLADAHRLHNDLHLHFSFTDLEFCGGVESYLNGNWEMKYTTLCSDDDYWATPNETVISFFRKYKYTDTGKYCSDDIRVVYSFSSGGHKYQSLNCHPQAIEAKYFKQNCFALVYAMNLRIHLLCIRRYVALRDPATNKLYMQALAFEIPIQPVTPLVDSPFCFKVDLTQLKNLSPRYTLISFHRLYILDLHFIPSCNNELYGVLLKTCIRQWKLFDDILIDTTTSRMMGDQEVNDSTKVV